VDLLLAATAALLLEVLLLARAWRQRASLRPLPECPSSGREADEVCVIVPARNEAGNIQDCLEGLLAQTYADKLRVLVVDDESDDGTDCLVEAIAGRDKRVQLVRSGPLRQGWTGKTQACWTGACRCGSAEWVCFIDADMRAEPGLVASAVAAGRRGVDFLSLAPRHCLVSFAERLMIPCGLYLLGFQQNLTGAAKTGRSDITVAGQFMLIRRSLYLHVGGHAAVASAICEDLELARLANGAGARLALLDGSKLLSTRMYLGWRTLWPGFAKNALETFGGSRRALATAAAALIGSWAAVILPAIASIGSLGSIEGRAALMVALAVAAIAIGFHVAGAAHFRIPLWFGLLFPAAYTIGAALILDGLRLRAARRIPWKGRVYP
jgi:chlorobactene glucosyltransferase